MIVLDGRLTCNEHHTTLISSQYRYFKDLYNAQHSDDAWSSQVKFHCFFLIDCNSFSYVVWSLPMNVGVFLFCFLFMLRRIFPCLGIQNTWVCDSIIIIVIIADLVLVPTSGGFVFINGPFWGSCKWSGICLAVVIVIIMC